MALLSLLAWSPEVVTCAAVVVVVVVAKEVRSQLRFFFVFFRYLKAL